MKQQVIMAVDVAPFLLLISSFCLDLLGISEAVIFMGFTKSYLAAPSITSLLPLLTTKPINNHAFWRTC